MSDSPSTPPGENDAVTTMIDKVKPVLQNITFGAVVGYCSGVAMKTMGQLMAVTIGIGFIGVQLVVGLEYVEVDWEKLKIDFVKKVDTNEDGKLDTADVKVWWKKLLKLLTHKIPSAGGFTVGFLYGAT
jgi:uncharacterized membrane protein (Fun14 family)